MCEGYEAVFGDVQIAMLALLYRMLLVCPAIIKLAVFRGLSSDDASSTYLIVYHTIQ